MSRRGGSIKGSTGQNAPAHSRRVWLIATFVFSALLLPPGAVAQEQRQAVTGVTSDPSAPPGINKTTKLVPEQDQRQNDLRAAALRTSSDKYLLASRVLGGLCIASILATGIAMGIAATRPDIANNFAEMGSIVAIGGSAVFATGLASASLHYIALGKADDAVRLEGKKEVPSRFVADALQDDKPVGAFLRLKGSF